MKIRTRAGEKLKGQDRKSIIESKSHRQYIQSDGETLKPASFIDALGSRHLKWVQEFPPTVKWSYHKITDTLSI